MSESAKAVFLSYASQDVAAALRICAALRAAGVEVWLDQEGGLVGGDAWDRKIREQINTCTLFVPLVSANTQARKEGYFRLEWHLAEERVRLIAKGVPFIVPVCVDGTTERGALVPDAFLAVQWTRLPGGEAPAAFVARVRKLLGVDGADVGPVADRAPGQRPGLQPAAPSLALPSAPSPSSEVTVRKVEVPTAAPHSPEAAFETFERQRPMWRRALPVVSAVLVTALVAGLVAWRLWPKATPAPVTRFSHRLPEGQTFRTSIRSTLAISPDGRKFVYNATGGLYVRTLDELESRVIPGTEESASSPFFSPDGRSVAFAQGGQLKRIALSGGTPVVIAPVPTTSGSGFSGGSWAPDDTIWFADSEGIRRVPATGGTPVTVIPAPAGQQLNSPRLLPGGDTVLFTERSPGNASAGPRICVLTLSTRVRKLLVESGFDACYLETGHLVYAVGNILMGVAFDVRRLSIVGGAVPVVRGVMRAPARTAAFSNYGIAADGTLVWVHSAVIESDTLWKLALSDRAGKLTPLALPAGPYDAPRASPDGKRVALTVADVKESYVAIYDLDGKTALRRLTFGGNNRHPVWSRDGQRVTFQSDREGDPALFWQRADGNGPAERLTKPEKDTAHVPASWSPQDENLLFTVIPASAPETLGALWTYTHASGTTAPFGNVEQSSQSPMFSPDGRWVVYYNGGRSGGSYVQPFPATGAQHQIPTAVGGPNALNPVWLPDGTALIFAPGAGQFASVSVTTQPTFAFGNPTLVPRSFPPMSPGAPRAYDILPDGRFIGLILPEQATATGGTVQLEIRIAERWAEELKRLVPVK